MKESFLGRYALVKRIGRGGMAEVWVAKSFGGNSFEKIVAIKILTPDKVSSEDYQRSFSDEAKIHVTLKHPNIVDIYDFNFEAQNPYLVMEYVEGAELREILRELRQRNETMPVGISCFIVSELAEALKHAHERRSESGQSLEIVHRDISPSNVLISTEGQVKLSDFGIAKSSLQSDFTKAGQIKGKFRYMSPEQASGETVDYRSDIFSLGLVFYELLFGRPAYDDPLETKIYVMARSGEVSFPASADPDLQGILDKLLASDPAERYPNLDLFQKEIRNYLLRHPQESDRSAFRTYLKTLQLPQMIASFAHRTEAENWNPVASSKILDETGHIATVEQFRSGGKKRKIFKWSLGGALVLSALLAILVSAKKRNTLPIANPVAMTTEIKEPKPVLGSLEVTSIPSEASVKIQYGDTAITKATPIVFHDLPLNVPVSLVISKKGYKTLNKKFTFTAATSSQVETISLTEMKDVEVAFNAEPFAEISIPNLISQAETPFRQKLPLGTYTVTFTHPPSGKQVTVSLDGSQGGLVSCSANMRSEEASSPATASCRKKP